MKRWACVLLALLLVSCGAGTQPLTPARGGAGTTAVPAAGFGNVRFTIDVQPATPTQRGRRAPQYVSPATKSLSIAAAGTTTNIDIASGSAGCTTDYSRPTIAEIAVNTQPRGMVQGPDGNMWFVEDAGYAIGTIAPGNVYTDYAFGAFENGIIVGPDGTLWTTSPYNAFLGHVTTAGNVSYFGGFPYDMQYLAKAADNTVWGTGYTQGPSNVLYHIAADGTFLSSDTISSFQGATTMPVLGPDNALYVTEGNGTTGWIARVAKANGIWSLTNEFAVPTVPYAIAVGPDAALWITDYSGHVYRMTTAGTITNTYPISSGLGAAIHALPDGALWIAEYTANKVGRLTTGGTLDEFAIPSANTHPYDVAAGSDGVYVTEQDANKVGRLNFPVSCTGTVALPTGTTTATVAAYDALGGAGGNGHVLSTQTTSISVPANATSTIDFVLNGVVASLSLTIAANAALCSSSGSVPIVVAARDPSGNAIIGPGTYSDANGDPLTVTIATSDTSGRSTIVNGAVTGPSSAPTLNWTGGVIPAQTLTATVSGGAIAGTITPAVVAGCPD